jgi:antagonist of KipI
MKITIKKAGLMTTLQDLGRTGFLSHAVPVSGVMDRLSALVANRALGNEDDCALIEFTQSGAAFFTEDDVLLAFSGDGAYLNTGSQRLPSERPLFIPAGTNVNLEHNKSGSRCYLAVAGGWDVPEVLGSRGTYLTAKIGGFKGRCLAENDRLTNTGKLTPLTQSILDSLKGETINYPGWSIARSLFLPENQKIIRVMPGREFNWFDAASKAKFLSQPYTIGYNSNRMGYHLQGTALKRAIEGELLSTAVMPGTVQVTNDGSLILLMADCQTTGGYPRIAQVAAVDMPLCAQLKPGDIINFEEISWKEAERLYLQFKFDMHKLSWAVGQKCGI